MRPWQVPKLWENQECWILGGGSSLTKEFNIPQDIIDKVRTGELPPVAYSPYLKSIHNKRVIGINCSSFFGDWIDICFFGDNDWYDWYNDTFTDFAGLMIGAAPKLSRLEDANVKYLKRDTKPEGISANTSTVCWNWNSGAASISLCHHLGVKRIILVGFDMDLDAQQNQHWHNLYPLQSALPFHSHLVGFNKIAKEAKELGIEIINASPNSKIKQFSKVSVKQLIWQEQMQQT